MGSIFELTMLVMFGISWPASIYKSWTSRKVGSKSLIFLIAVILGYIAGIINKIWYHYDYVIWFYILNLLLVLTDTILYFRNQHLEKAGESK